MTKTLLKRYLFSKSYIYKSKKKKKTSTEKARTFTMCLTNKKLWSKVDN